MDKIEVSERVILIGSHIWAGHSGVIIGVMDTLVGEMYNIELDNGINVGAKEHHIKSLQE
jgi:hypothetical protein